MEHLSLIKLFSSFAMLGAEWVMWLLVALSALSIAVLVDRVLYFRGLRDDLGALGDAINAKLRAGDLHGARKRLAESPSPAGLVPISSSTARPCESARWSCSAGARRAPSCFPTSGSNPPTFIS